MPKPVHYQNGVSNVAPGDPLYEYGMLDPTKYHVFFDDFDTFTAANWTITSTDGGGDSGEVNALADADGGVLTVTTNDADNDNELFNKVGESFLYDATKKMFFKARFKADDVTQSDIVMGLQITDTDIVVTDGIFFQKDDGDANLDFHVQKNSTATDELAIVALADDTYVEVAFAYIPDSAVKPVATGKFHLWVDGVYKGFVANTNAPDDTELTISFGIQAGEAAAKTLSVDYILAIKER